MRGGWELSQSGKSLESHFSTYLPPENSFISRAEAQAEAEGEEKMQGWTSAAPRESLSGRRPQSPHLLFFLLLLLYRFRG